MSTLAMTEKKRMHPKKFAMWVGIVGMVMMFAALTSAYIVRRAAGDWMNFKLPDEFFISTALIISSGVLLQLAHRAFTKGRENLYKTFIVLSFALGIGFLATQYAAWNVLNENGVYMQSNPSSSFLFLITGLHALHVLAGIGALTAALIGAFRFKFAVTPKRKLHLELILIFWHFVDVLWIYLLVFFIIQQ